MKIQLEVDKWELAQIIIGLREVRKRIKRNERRRKNPTRPSVLAMTLGKLSELEEELTSKLEKSRKVNLP